MRDVIVLVVVLAFFALCLAYVRWCDLIIGPDPLDLDAHEGDDVAASAIAAPGGATEVPA
jgi:hypothetical protein